ncbi:MAG TPA: glutamine amidotransferase [Xanthomonadales bacterium]|nr:glutamine amidotransferase [Xanthomonadales bacterium]
MKPLLLIKTGTTIPEIIPAHGDFEQWFAAALGEAPLLVVDVFRGKRLPEPETVAGAVITGSAAMVSHREDWSECTAHWLSAALEDELPVLGVCYGHQLLAHALGGTVGPNPGGREMGTQKVQTQPAAAHDPLFREYPAEFLAHTTHLEAVIEPPSTAVRLASSELDENLVLRFADSAWGVQYHPEFPAEVMREYIRRRAGVLSAEGQDPEAMIARVAEAPLAASILPAFAKRFAAAQAA